MRACSCVVASLLVAASLASQATAQQMPEHVRGALDKLVGKWTMETSVDGTKTQSKIVIEWAVKDTTLMFKWHGTGFVTGKEEASTGILGWDPIKQLVVEYEIGSGGFASQATHHISKNGKWTSPIRGSAVIAGKAVFCESHRTFKLVSRNEWIVTGADRVIDGKPQPDDISTFRRVK